MPNLTLEQALEMAWSAYQAGQLAEAESLARQILRYQQTNVSAWQLVGLSRCQTGDLAEGFASLQRAVQLEPGNADIRNNFATALSRAGQLEPALVQLHEAIKLRPTFAEAYYNIANIDRDCGEYSQAMDGYRKAIQLKPDFPAAQNNLANALKDCGQVTEALEIYRDLLALHPDPRIGSNYVYSMHFEPDAGPRRLLIAHQQWNDDYAAALTASAAPHDAALFESDRKLRIGYVSPDFRNHPVGRFILPLLMNHDASRFEVSCYSDVMEPDSMTARLRAAVKNWHDTGHLNHEQLSEKIRGDQIDILVDLTMHMDGSRLLAFARKPAPIQVTYLAYCSTTGMSAMDYRISDWHLDPPGVDESLYTERTVRLEHCYWCYVPPIETPALTPRMLGSTVFGCLNNFGKVNAGVISTWSEILLKVEDSRLLLFAPSGDHRERAAGQFAAHGVDPARIAFVGAQPITEYMNVYQQIDIALDPFPYPGGTTSCDALWMGTPVVTLTGQTAVSRSGASILKTIGLNELVTESREGYVAKAISLARHPEKLAELRSVIRAKMQASTLMNAGLFAQNMEAAFTEMSRNQRKSSTKQG